MGCIGLVRDGACRKESILVIFSNILKRRALVCGSVRFLGWIMCLSLDLFRRPVGLSHRSCPKSTVSFQRYLVLCSRKVLLTPRNGVPFVVTQSTVAVAIRVASFNQVSTVFPAGTSKVGLYCGGQSRKWPNLDP